MKFNGNTKLINFLTVGLLIVVIFFFQNCERYKTINQNSEINESLNLDDGSDLLVFKKTSEVSNSDFFKTIQNMKGKIVAINPENSYIVQVNDNTSRLNNLPTDDRIMISPKISQNESSNEISPSQNRLLRSSSTGETVYGLGAEVTNYNTIKRFNNITKVDNINPNNLSKLRATINNQGEVQTKSVTTNLPRVVDNSTSHFFPPVGNQGGVGSCTTWSTGYYYTSYTQAKAKGLPIRENGVVNSELICSPAFLYPQVNGGENIGSYEIGVLDLITRIGCTPISILPANIPANYFIWPSLDQRVAALKLKNSNLKYIGYRKDGTTGFDENEISLIKQHLANGEIAAISFPVHNNFFSYNNDSVSSAGIAQKTGISNGVYYEKIGNAVGGHSVAIVGYDDDKEYTVNGIKKMGAFLFVNSWSSKWGTSNSIGDKGFFWVSYDLFKQGFLNGIVFTDPTPSSETTIYAGVFGSARSKYNTNYGAAISNSDKIQNDLVTLWSLDKTIPFMQDLTPLKNSFLGVDTPIVIDLSSFFSSGNTNAVSKITVGMLNTKNTNEAYLEKVVLYEDIDRDNQWIESTIAGNHLMANPIASVEVPLDIGVSANKAQPSCSVAIVNKILSWEIQHASKYKYKCYRNDNSLFIENSVPSLTGSIDLSHQTFFKDGDFCEIQLNDGVASCKSTSLKLENTAYNLSSSELSKNISDITVSINYKISDEHWAKKDTNRVCITLFISNGSYYFYSPTKNQWEIDTPSSENNCYYPVTKQEGTVELLKKQDLYRYNGVHLYVGYGVGSSAIFDMFYSKRYIDVGILLDKENLIATASTSSNLSSNQTTSNQNAPNRAPSSTVTNVTSSSSPNCTDVVQASVSCASYAGQYGIPASATKGNASWTKNSCSGAIKYTGGCYN